MPEKATKDTKAAKPKTVAKTKEKNPSKGVFAVIETGGKQYMVREGTDLVIEKLPKPTKGNVITFDQVLLIDDGKKTDIGTPYLEGKTVTAEFTDEGRGKKITVLKFKRKTRYKVKKGHRQPYTKVKIKSL